MKLKIAHTVFRTPIYINSSGKCSSLEAGRFNTQL